MLLPCARVEANVFFHGRTVGITHISKILEFSRRAVAYCCGDRSEITAYTVPPGHTVVEIIPPIVALDDIGSVHEISLAVIGILRSFITYSLAAPVGQIVYGR